MTKQAQELTLAQRHVSLWLISVLHAITHIYQFALLPLYLAIRSDLHLTGDWQATMLVTVQGVAYYIVSLPVGILADKMSRKHLLTIGAFMNALAMLGLAFAPNYGWAIVWMAAAGLSGSFFHPAATPLMVALFPERPGWAVGRAAIGAAFGFFIAPFYAGWRAQAAGWRQPCLELAMAGVVAAVLFHFFAREPHDAPHSAGRATEHRTRRQWKMLLGVALVALAFSARDFGASGITTFNSLFLQRGLGFDAKATGVLLGLMFLTGILSNPLLGALSDRRRSLAGTVTILCTAAFAVLIPWAPRAWMWLALCLYGFFTLATYPIIEAALMESVPDVLRGRTFGVFITVGGTISSFAHWAMGHVADLLQHRAAGTQSPLLATDFAPWYALLAGLIAVSVIGVRGIRWLRTSQAA
jgi:MFS transporter, FSR family, fosmidomycin resistance protein